MFIDNTYHDICIIDVLMIDSGGYGRYGFNIRKSCSRRCSRSSSTSSGSSTGSSSGSSQTALWASSHHFCYKQAEEAHLHPSEQSCYGAEGLVGELGLVGRESCSMSVVYGWCTFPLWLRRRTSRCIFGGCRAVCFVAICSCSRCWKWNKSVVLMGTLCLRL